VVTPNLPERKNMKKLMALGLLGLSTAATFAQSNIDQVVDTVDGYRTAAVAVGIAVLLFVIGRKVVRKLI